jgi:hypothetical protein
VAFSNLTSQLHSVFLVAGNVLTIYGAYDCLKVTSPVATFGHEKQASAQIGWNPLETGLITVVVLRLPLPMLAWGSHERILIYSDRNAVQVVVDEARLIVDAS